MVARTVVTRDLIGETKVHEILRDYDIGVLLAYSTCDATVRSVRLNHDGEARAPT